MRILSLNTALLRSLYAVCLIGAVVSVTACNSNSSNSQAVAPIPPGPTTLPPSPTPTPTPVGTPTPTPVGTPTPTPVGTATPTSPPTASTTEPIFPSGAPPNPPLTIPPIGGYTGMVDYAANSGSSTTTITFVDSVINFFGAPTPPGGNPIFYTRTTLNANGSGVVFNKGKNLVSTLSNTNLVPSDTYSLCAYIGTFPIQSTPVVAGMPKNGTLTYPTPLQARTVPANVAIDVVTMSNVPTTCVIGGRTQLYRRRI
jgi:hypothetical protein